MLKLTATTKHRKRGMDRIRASTSGAVRRKFEAHIGTKEPEVANVAAYNELGTSTIPPRSFMRQAGDTRGPQWTKGMEEGGKAFMAGRGDLKKTLAQVGKQAARDIQESIVKLASPPNDPDTEEEKGSSNPLVDTGRLVASIKVEVP